VAGEASERCVAGEAGEAGEAGVAGEALKACEAAHDSTVHGGPGVTGAGKRTERGGKMGAWMRHGKG